MTMKNDTRDPWDPTLNLTAVERMDLISYQAEQDRQLAQIQSIRDIAVAKQETKQQRWEVTGWVGVATLIAIVLLGIIYAIYKGSTGPPSPDLKQQACIDAGGSYIPISDSKTLCLVGVKQVKP